MITVELQEIQGLYVIKPNLIEDERGHFFRSICKKELEHHGIEIDEIVQVNRSFNRRKGTFRGLHYQNPPFAEEKIIACIQGEVVDIIVDVRTGSPTFLKHVKITLSAHNKKSVLIPKGCAHGFITMCENSELLYFHTNYYMPSSEGAISISDPIVDISLPVDIEEISVRDKKHPLLSKNFTGIEI